MRAVNVDVGQSNSGFRNALCKSHFGNEQYVIAVYKPAYCQRTVLVYVFKIKLCGIKKMLAYAM
jgi:hypothetical protein